MSVPMSDSRLFIPGMASYQRIDILPSSAKRKEWNLLVPHRQLLRRWGSRGERTHTRCHHKFNECTVPCIYSRPKR